MALKYLSLAIGARLVSSNFVSPGLDKCMTIGPFHEGEAGKRDAILAVCTTEEKQDWGITSEAKITSKSGLCLQADAGEANSEVHATECSDVLLQKWELTEHGYVKLSGLPMCLDVTAAKKADGTYETWDEIKLHDTVHLQIYDCHDYCTSRVNQLWGWAPITGNDFGSADVEHSDLGVVAGNLVSPGLAKCLDAGGDQTAEALLQAAHINVHLTTCNDKFNQNFEVLDGKIAIPALGKCLVAEAALPNANVMMGECSEDSLWELTPYGYIALQGTDLCLDVKAKKKVDGTYEVWDEIKAHPTVNVHLYTCHEVTTSRVNQLWEWSPVTPDAMASRPECATTQEPSETTGGAAGTTGGAAGTTGGATGSMPIDIDLSDELAVDDLYEKFTLNASSVGPLAIVGATAFLFAAFAVSLVRSTRSRDSDVEALIPQEE